MTKENEKKYEPSTGNIRKGMIVEPGETMAKILRKRSDDPELKLLGVLTKSSVGRYKADPIVWSRDVSGEVVDVEQTNKEIRIMVKTKEPAKLGDKLSGRHGEKGVITLIIPDAEMPVRKSDGKPIDMTITYRMVGDKAKP